MTDCTECFAVRGQCSIIDVIHPGTGRSWIENETLEEIRQRYPGAEVMNFNDFCREKADRQNTPIEWVEITEEQYEYALNVLPPMDYREGMFLVEEPCDHYVGNGNPRYQAYAARYGKHFTASRPMQRAEFKEWRNKPISSDAKGGK